MFRNTKRIKALEQEVFNLRLELENIKSELASVKGVVDALVDEMAVVHLDGDDYIKILNETEGGRSKVEEVALMKDIYEKKLKRFIRSSSARRKPKTNTDGKETPKATE